MNQQDFEEVTLLHYLAVIRRHWLVVFVCGVLLGVVASIYAFTATKQYQVEVVLASADLAEQSLASSLSSQFSQLTGFSLGSVASSSKGLEAIVTMQSASFTGNFVVTNKLLEHLFSEEWDANEKQWIGEVPSLDDAIENWSRNILDIKQDRDSGFWTLAVTWKDPAVAVQWASMMVSAINEHVRARDQTEVRRALDYLESEIEQTKSVAIQQAIYSLVEAQMKIDMLAKVRDEYALRTISPALVPDEDHYTYPKRGILIFFGLVAGLSAGVLLAFVLEYGVAARNVD